MLAAVPEAVAAWQKHEKPSLIAKNRRDLLGRQVTTIAPSPSAPPKAPQGRILEFVKEQTK